MFSGKLGQELILSPLKTTLFQLAEIPSVGAPANLFFPVFDSTSERNFHAARVGYPAADAWKLRVVKSFGRNLRTEV